MRVEILSWAQAEAHAAPIRFALFVEMKQAEGFELDELDRDCVHAMAYDDAGKAIGTARMQPDGQIGPLAIVMEWRRRGVDAAMLEGLVNEARKRGLSEVRLSAPVQALELYQSQGFVADGKIRPVGGGLEQPMKKPLGG